MLFKNHETEIHKKMPKNRELTLAEHGEIIGMHRAGWKQVQIAKETGHAHSTISDLIKKWKIHGSVDNIP